MAVREMKTKLCYLFVVFTFSGFLKAEASGMLEAFVGEPKLEIQQIFAGERFPNVVVTTEGTVLATWSRENYRVRRSEDGGRSWGPQIAVGTGIHAGGVTVDQSTGYILVFTEQGHPPSPFSMYRSKDDGKTWQKVDDVTIHEDVNGNIPSLHMCEAGMTLEHGAHSGRLIRPARVYGSPNNYNTAIYSDDGGQNWYPTAPFPELRTGEGSVAELSDGSLLYDSRINATAQDRPEPTKRRFAWSHDGGDSWDDWRIMDVLPDGPEDMVYGLMGGLTRLPVQGRDILIFSNVDNSSSDAYTYKGREFSDRFSGRRRGTVWASFDGGQSWPIKRLVYEGPFAYSSLAAGRAGTASQGWIYLQFEGGPRGHHSDGQMARFNLSWVLNGQLTGDGELPEDIYEIRSALQERPGPESDERLLTLPASFCDSESPVLFEKDIFYQGMDGYHTFRIPALIEAPDGTLLAFAEGRRDSPRDNGDVDTVLRRSFDGGKTWQPTQIVWADGTNTCGNPTVVVDQIKERIWLFMTHNIGTDTQRQISTGTSEGVRTIWSCYSDDNGDTWSEPVNRFEEVQPADVRWDATGPGNGIQLLHGPNKGRLVIPANGRNIQSDDHGRTWYEGTRLPAGTSEATIVELNSGTLMRNSRATGGLRDHRCRIVNYSDDQGQSWSDLQVRDDLPCPICQASVVMHKIPGLGERVLLFANPSKYEDDDSTSHDRRLRMTVRKSHRDGQVFENSKVVFPRDAAYSSIAGMSEGQIGLLYENGNDWPYRRITFSKFSPEWIKDPGLLRLNFEQYEQGQWLSNTPNAITGISPYGFSATARRPLLVVPGSGIDDSNSAVRFDQRSGSIYVDDDHSRGRLNFDSDMSFVIRVVFRTESHQDGGASGAGALVAKDVGPSRPSWWLRVQDGRARFLMDDGESSVSIYSDKLVSDGKWHDLTVFRNADSRRLYMILNGRISNPVSDFTEGDFVNENNVAIGSFNNGTSRFVGDIERVEIAAELVGVSGSGLFCYD